MTGSSCALNFRLASEHIYEFGLESETKQVWRRVGSLIQAEENSYVDPMRGIRQHKIKNRKLPVILISSRVEISIIFISGSSCWRVATVPNNSLQVPTRVSSSWKQVIKDVIHTLCYAFIPPRVRTRPEFYQVFPAFLQSAKESLLWKCDVRESFVLLVCYRLWITNLGIREILGSVPARTLCSLLILYRKLLGVKMTPLLFVFPSRIGMPLGIHAAVDWILWPPTSQKCRMTHGWRAT